MTRNVKALIIVVILIGLLIGGYRGAQIYQESKAKAKSAQQYNFPSIDYISLTSYTNEDLVKLEFPRDGFVLERRGDNWEAIPAFPGPLNQSEIRNALWSLASMQSERVIEEAPGDLALYGLDDPRGQIIITTKSGESVEFLGGDMTPSRSGYYIMVKGDPKVYQVSSYSGAPIYLDAFAIRDKDLIPSFDTSTVSRFILESTAGRIDISPKPMHMVTLAPFSSMVMTSPYKVMRGVDSEKFGQLLESLQNIRIVNFVDPEPKSLAAYGLDKPVRVFWETPEESFDLLLGNTEGGLRYAQRRGAAEVFTINDISALANLSPFSLADKFALILNIVKVDSVTIRGGSRDLASAIRHQNEDEASYFLNGKEAEEKSYKGWYQTVIGLLVDSEYPERSPPSAPAEITIEYTMNDPAGAKPFIRLIPYNRDFYALESEGAVEFLISRNQVRTLYETAEKVVFLE